MRWYDSRAYSGRQLPRAKTRVVSRTHSNSDPVYSDFLMHYGIAGQKWGVRRYENEDGTLTEEGKVRYNKKSESETWKKSDLRNLSDDELNKRNSRLQRERQYRDLTTTDREREISQFKKDVIKKALLLPVLGILAVAGRKYIGNAVSFIGKMAKNKIAPKVASYRAAGTIHNILKKQPNVPDMVAPMKEILGKHVHRI